MSKIHQSLENLFSQHRIVLWYDAERAFTEEYEALESDGIEKLVVDGNEFRTKVKVLHEQPKQKFLLYLPYEKPANQENWLLDIELSHHVFHTDKEALYLQEVGLGYHYKQWISPHVLFFSSKERTAAFKGIAREEDGDALLSLKLLQVVFKAEMLSFDIFLRKYASAYLKDGAEQLINYLKRFELFELFWKEVASRYGYNETDPSIYDFLLEAFKKNFTPMQNQSSVQSDTTIMLSVWKDTLSFQDDLKALSKRIEADLPVEEALEKAALDDIVEDDLFELIEKRIIFELVQGISDNSINPQRLKEIIKKRESTYWYDQYVDFYRAIKVGFNLLETIRHSDETLKIKSFDDGLEQYRKSWYSTDQQYRIFIQYYRQLKQNNVLNKLYQQVNKAYSNTWLLKLSDEWQKVLDDTPYWQKHPKAQTRFFRNSVRPFITKKTRLFVIISDALRYECGVSFQQQMLQENRFECSLDYQLAPLPSFTKLGMASLLPHEELSFGKEDDILIDGKSTKGLAARRNVLQKNAGTSATTIFAEDLMKMATKGDEAKQLVAENELIYVYHNRIDKQGDDKTSEEKVIEAARDEIQFLVDLIKKIANIGGYNMVITADHGFIYQNEPLEPSDFMEAQVEGDVIKTNRRFIIGTGLTHTEQNVAKYTCEQLGIKGDYDILIPKGINRLRVQGAGSRFVHGGATLQEIVTPVISVKKKREDTLKKVEVEILNRSNNKISTNIQRVNFYQTVPAGDRVQERNLKAQFRSPDGEALSDVFTYCFNSESESSRDREVKYNFQLSSKASTEYQGKQIYLVLEEQIPESNQWNEYQKIPYEMKIAFMSDFD